MADYKYATLSVANRWLINVAATSGAGTGKITAPDLVWAEKFAYFKIKKRLGRRFDTSTWVFGTKVPIEVAEAAEALGAAAVLRFRVAQGGSTGKGTEAPWKSSWDFAEEVLKDIERSGLVSFDDGNDDQRAKHPRGAYVKGPGATFFPPKADDESHGVATPFNVEDTYKGAL